MPDQIRVIQIGLGPLGRMLTPYLLEKTSLRVVGAVDIDPALTGKDLGELGGGAKLGVPVSGNLGRAAEADVAIVTTVSSLKGAAPTVLEALAAGLAVVSTCEELSFPWKTQPDLAGRVDAAAKKAGKAVLGTGVNPGFLMDFLPLAASAVCRRVTHVRVERIQDASSRRLPFREKIGAGLSAAEFDARVKAGKIRHVGLTESMHLLAWRLGWDVGRTEDRIEPVIAEGDVVGTGWRISGGAVAGVQQTGRAFCVDREVIRLVFRAAVGQKDPRDTVTLSGDREYVMTVPGGTHGDIATCAIVSNAVPVVRMAAPGLRTMADLPVITAIP